MAKIINDQKLLATQLLYENLQEKTRLTSTNYPDKVTFDCGCGENHKVNDPSLFIINIAFPVKFLFLCPNDYIAFVHVKGFFVQKANCLWSCKSKLYESAMKEFTDLNSKK